MKLHDGKVLKQRSQYSAHEEVATHQHKRTSCNLHTHSCTNTHFRPRKVYMTKSLLCTCPCRPSAPIRVWVRVPSRTPPSLLLITTNWPHSFFFSPLRYNGIIHLYNLMSRHSRHRARSSATSIEKTKAERNKGKRRHISALKYGESFSA